MITKDWLDEIAPKATINAIATRAGLYASTLDSQVKRGHLSAEVVIKIARAYHVPVLEGLVRCGILTEEEAKLRHTLSSIEALSQVTDRQLLEELLRRADTDGPLAHPQFYQPLDNVLSSPANSDDLSDRELAALALADDPITMAAHTAPTPEETDHEQ